MKYEIDVWRTSFALNTIIVDGENMLDARNNALEIAGDLEYIEKDFEYNTGDVTKIDE